jgi:hypothetical protein
MHYGVPSFLKINCLDHFRVQIIGEHGNTKREMEIQQVHA